MQERHGAAVASMIWRSSARPANAIYRVGLVQQRQVCYERASVREKERENEGILAGNNPAWRCDQGTFGIWI